MPVIRYTMSCLSKEMIAPNVYELSFRKPENFAFKAGQFVLFDVPDREDAKNIQPRAYSIASSPAEENLLFLIKLVPNGRASIWVKDILAVGSKVEMQGVFGTFTLSPEEKKREYLFLATGTGIAPFRSHVLWLLKEKRDTRVIRLILGVRETKDLFWQKQCMDLMKEYPQFQFHTSVTTGKSDWDGHRGKIHEIAEQITPDFSQVSLYCCGAPDMVKDIKERALTQWKMQKQDVHTEGYV